MVPNGIGLWFGILDYLLRLPDNGLDHPPGKKLSAHSKGLIERNLVSAHSKRVSRHNMAKC